GFEARRPVPVETTGTDVRQIEGRRSRAVNRLRVREHIEKAANRKAVGLHPWGKAGDDHRLVEPTEPTGVDRASIQRCAAPLRGGEQLVAGRIIDDADEQLASALQTDRDRIIRKAVHVIRSAIERIDHPAVARGAGTAQKSLFAQKTMLRITSM